MFLVAHLAPIPFILSFLSFLVARRGATASCLRSLHIPKSYLDADHLFERPDRPGVRGHGAMADVGGISQYWGLGYLQKKTCYKRSTVHIISYHTKKVWYTYKTVTYSLQIQHRTALPSRPPAVGSCCGTMTAGGIRHHFWRENQPHAYQIGWVFTGKS